MKYYNKSKLINNNLSVGDIIKNYQSLHYQITNIIKLNDNIKLSEYEIKFLVSPEKINVFGYEIINDIIDIENVITNKTSLDIIRKNDFILISNLIHNNKYDYSNIESIKYLSHKYDIFCTKHGLFSVTGINHINGVGCSKCNIESKSKQQLKPIEDILKLCKDKYGDAFDYSKVQYNESNQKIQLICKQHRDNKIFVSYNKLPQYPCIDCYNLKNDINRQTNFVNKLKELYGDMFDYSLVNYTSMSNKVKLICKKHGEFEQYPSNLFKGSNCQLCGKESFTKLRLFTTEQFIEQATLLHNNKYDYSLVEYVGAREKVKIICKQHGEFEQISSNHLQGKGCPKCVNRQSKNELELIEFVKQYNTNILLSTKSVLNNNKEIDIYLTDLKLGIEYNGLYYHSDDYRDDNYHLLKTNDCINKGITLIHIFEDEWINKKEIVKSRLLNIMNITPNKIYARNTYVKEIDYNSAKVFLENNHIQGSVAGTCYIALFEKKTNLMISLMTFGKLRKNLGRKSEDDSYELLRFCNILNTTVIGGASKLLKYFETKYKPKYILSYADRRWSTGNLYNQLGFNFSHNSTPNYFYVNGLKRLNRFSFRKDILITKYNCSPELTEREFVTKHLGYPRIYDCGNLVFEKFYDKQ